MSSDYSADEESSDGEPELCQHSSCIFGQSERCAQCEATAALDQEIYRVHHILDSLYRTRKSYLQNMNSVHDPIVSRLPVEVISHIFTFFIPQTVHQSYGPVLTLDEDEELRTTPFFLGAVCKTWRSIAWSTTLLWTSMSLNIYKYYDGLDQVVREWLGRSGRWPLYIQLYASHGSGRFRRDTTNADEVYGAKLMDAINAYSDRWSHLDLNIPIQFMRRLHAKADGELGMLNTLKVANGLGHGYALENDDMIDFGAIPNLQSLCARGPDFHQIDYIRYESLTDVEASSLTVANCVCLLYIAPLITRLTVHKLVEGTANFKEDLMIRHDKLIWLEVNDCWSSKLASFLSFPSLVHLGAEIHKENGSDTESIQALLERSSCALKSMRLRLPSMSKKEGTDPEPVVEIIKSTIPPSIETLELVCPFYKPSPGFDIDVIIRNSSRLGMPQEPIQRNMCLDFLLPNLKDLRIRGTKNPWSCTFDLSCREPESPFSNALYELGFSWLSPKMVPPQATLQIQHYHFSHLLDFSILKQLEHVFEKRFSVAIPQHLNAKPPFLTFLEKYVFQYKFDADEPKKPRRFSWDSD